MTIVFSPYTVFTRSNVFSPSTDFIRSNAFSPSIIFKFSNLFAPSFYASFCSLPETNVAFHCLELLYALLLFLAKRDEVPRRPRSCADLRKGAASLSSRQWMLRLDQPPKFRLFLSLPLLRSFSCICAASTTSGGFLDGWVLERWTYWWANEKLLHFSTNHSIIVFVCVMKKVP